MSLLRCDWSLEFQPLKNKNIAHTKKKKKKENENKIIHRWPAELIRQSSFEIKWKLKQVSFGQSLNISQRFQSSGQYSKATASSDISFQVLFFLSLLFFSLYFTYFWLEEMVSLQSIVGAEMSTRNKTQNRIVDWWNDIKLSGW